jgi:hypothetical protein
MYLGGALHHMTLEILDDGVAPTQDGGGVQGFELLRKCCEDEALLPEIGLLEVMQTPCEFCQVLALLAQAQNRRLSLQMLCGSFHLAALT